MNITEETIDSFLRGDLNSAETAAFNKAVSADPKLQQEVSIQKDIIDSVKQYRHQQLKNRMNAIEVKPVGFGFLGSPYVKLAASVAIVALIVGSFSLFNKGNEGSTVAVESNTIDDNTSATAANTEIESPVVSSSQTTSGSETPSVAADQKTTATSVIPNNTKAVSGSSKKSKSQNNASDVAHTDLSEEPLDTDNAIDGINDNFDMPAMNHGGNTSTISSPQIKVSIVKENNLGYRFFNNQLFLHGNFSNSTYELFELNNKPSKQLFLYFENNYYELIQGKTKVTSLKPITDKAILLQLTQLREH
ncbi:hypothetical protein [Cytophaga aurantiaca]|uniref:hypothetical protein n=1 Tax=Cytophaga aurantiaca TaxID=29530 RepID=UPI000361CC4C|nr:hypothetical protein [Cytophaga aurantiaca]